VSEEFGAFEVKCVYITYGFRSEIIDSANDFAKAHGLKIISIEETEEEE
jgi:hypothetical protein